MEKFNLDNYNSIVGRYGTGYYHSKDKSTIASSAVCQCKRNYHQLWKPIKSNCEQCDEIKELKNKVDCLENSLEYAESNLFEKEQIIENLKKKLAIFENNEDLESEKETNLRESFNNFYVENVDKFAEPEMVREVERLKKLRNNLNKTISKSDSHSESNYSLVEEQAESDSNNVSEFSD